MKRWNFNTLAEFTRACDALSQETKNSHDRFDWTGESWTDSIRYAHNGGTESRIAAALAMIDKIQASLPETISRRWALEHAGAFPCVPAYLSGEPESMWALADTPNESSPVRVFIASTSSAAVGYQDLIQRGCACLALVMLASRTRPVELYSYAHCAERLRKPHRGDAFIVQRLQSHPMMLSEVAYVLTSAGWARNLTYAFLSEKLGYSNLKWADAQAQDHYQGGLVTRRLLGLELQDVLIGPAHCNDPAVKDPIGFVTRELAKLGLAEVLP